jgi:hypothetical protein
MHDVDVVGILETGVLWVSSQLWVNTFRLAVWNWPCESSYATESANSVKWVFLPADNQFLNIYQVTCDFSDFSEEKGS